MNEFCGKRYENGVCVMIKSHHGCCENNYGRELKNRINVEGHEVDPDVPSIRLHSGKSDSLQRPMPE